MKRSACFFIAIVLSIPITLNAQNTTTNSTPEDYIKPNGLRLKKGIHDYIIYGDDNLAVNPKVSKKINSTVYFKRVKDREATYKGKKYVMISIPGNRKKPKAADKDNPYINSSDFGDSFWIEAAYLDDTYVDLNYPKFSHQVFGGLLTAPFKYRVDKTNGDLIDGDFNVAPFLGWKFRMTPIRAYYLAIFGFGGITTLKYNSANNSKITDSNIEENSSGLTYGLGISFRFGDLSPGLIVGFDKGTGNLGSGFNYNNKCWLSFSLNYDFFKPKESTKSLN